MSFRSGFGAVEKAAQSTNQNSGGSWFTIYWKDSTGQGDLKILRNLSDDPIVVGLHEYIPCNDGKRRTFVCAKELDKSRRCPICEDMVQTNQDGTTRPYRPRDIAISLAVLREEKQISRGEFEYSDVTEEVEVTSEVAEKAKALGLDLQVGEKLTVPQVGFVQNSLTNFWNNLNGFFARYGTIMDRDYAITRHGNGLDTKYQIVPCDVVEELRDPEKVEDRYKIAKLFHLSVQDYLEVLGSEGYYKKHLGPDSDPAPAPSSNSAGSLSLQDQIREYRSK
jgi:hypothetical protein|nr:MAG TPA: DNA binding protein like protein [Caudoviricetes sp.]